MSLPMFSFLPRMRRAPLVPAIRLDGVIDAGGRFGRGLNLYDLDEILEPAFSYRHSRHVALVINSPGGSPVQSALILRRIRTLAKKHNKTVLGFAEDVAASGGYMLAIAADEIFADASTMIGSIGVVSSGFGFTNLLEKAGVERRLYTAGKSKASLDPFSPEDPDEVAKLKAMQEDVHETFISLVKDRRGDKLKGDDETLFNGDVWTGEKAVNLGLIDGLGDMHTVLQEKLGSDVRVRFVESRRGFLRQQLGLDMSHDLRGLLGALVDGALDAAEKRSLWARFGR
ncbi:MAG: S49 family peptidase [Alphaproteobacteria bacterium]